MMVLGIGHSCQKVLGRTGGGVVTTCVMIYPLFARIAIYCILHQSQNHP